MPRRDAGTRQKKRPVKWEVGRGWGKSDSPAWAIPPPMRQASRFSALISVPSPCARFAAPTASIAGDSEFPAVLRPRSPRFRSGASLLRPPHARPVGGGKPGRQKAKSSSVRFRGASSSTIATSSAECRQRPSPATIDCDAAADTRAGVRSAIREKPRPAPIGARRKLQRCSSLMVATEDRSAREAIRSERSFNRGTLAGPVHHQTVLRASMPWAAISNASTSRGRTPLPCRRGTLDTIRSTRSWKFTSSRTVMSLPR